jgi:hypothetical protein
MTSIDSFARRPILFGPSPVHRLDRLTPASWWWRVDLGQARGLRGAHQDVLDTSLVASA